MNFLKVHEKLIELEKNHFSLISEITDIKICFQKNDRTLILIYMLSDEEKNFLISKLKLTDIDSQEATFTVTKQSGDYVFSLEYIGDTQIMSTYIINQGNQKFYNYLLNEYRNMKEKKYYFDFSFNISFSNNLNHIGTHEIRISKNYITVNEYNKFKSETENKIRDDIFELMNVNTKYKIK